MLSGYPQDDEVVGYCIGELEREPFPFVLLHLDAWMLLQRNFRDHPLLVAALDRWIPRQQFHEPEVALAALVGRTSTGKQKLLASVDSRWSHWPAEALLEGWGLGDTELRRRLEEMAFGEPDRAARIGYLLPKIIGNADECRVRLLTLLRDPTVRRPDLVLQGLVELGNTEGDEEVVTLGVEAVLPRLMHDMFVSPGVMMLLIRHYATDDRVRALALRELDVREGDITSVAVAYGQDEAIRHQVMRLACPLPRALREIIAARLGEGPTAGDFELSLLGGYDQEPDAAVKTQASIRHHRQLRDAGRDLDPALRALDETLGCTGLDLEARRGAALAGLIVLNRLDLATRPVDGVENTSRPFPFQLNWPRDPNISLVRLLLEHWDEVRAAFRDGFWSKFSSGGEHPADRWEAFALFADDYPSAREEALRFFREDAAKVASENVLRFLARTLPTSGLLLEYCLGTLRIGDDQHDVSGPPAVIAAELLGRDFGGDASILERIVTERSKQHVYQKVILALCEGWPKSEELADLAKRVPGDWNLLSPLTRYELLCRKQPSQLVFEAMIRVIEHLSHDYLWLGPAIARLFIRRLQDDDELLERCMVALKGDASPSLKATIPRLIASSGGVKEELREWCLEEVKRQHARSAVADIGVDLVAGELRLVTDALLDVLEEPGNEDRRRVTVLG